MKRTVLLGGPLDGLIVAGWHREYRSPCARAAAVSLAAPGDEEPISYQPPRCHLWRFRMFHPDKSPDLMALRYVGLE